MKLSKLEKADYAILREITNNSRISTTKLGKIIHLNRENVSYRLNRLKKCGILKSTNAVININALKFKQYALFLQFVRLSKQKETEIIKLLKSHKSISWIGILVGKWSLVLDIYAKGEEGLTKSMHEILNMCSGYIKEYALLPLEKKEYFLNKLFNPKTICKKRHAPIFPKLDIVDLRLLRLLNKNSQVSYSALSEQFNLTPNALKKRIKKLEREGIILGYTCWINHRTLGFEWYGLQLKLLDFNEKTIKELIGYFQSNQRIIFYYKYISGAWDFDLGILLKDFNELRTFINELREKFSKKIQINDFFILLEEITDNSLPDVIFERDI